MESYNYIQTADRSRLSKESIACGTHLRFLRGTLVASATVVATGVYPIGGVVANVSVAVMILWVPAAAGLRRSECMCGRRRPVRPPPDRNCSRRW